jgi:hypothetical protein
MTQETTAEEQTISQEIRDRARELGWEDGLIDTALARGHTAQEIVGAISARITGEVARAFLESEEGEAFYKPSFAWMDVPTEWGVRARPADPELGLTIGDLNVGIYGDIPDVWPIRSEIARGSFPAVALQDMGYTIFEKAPIWADCVVPLYEIAIRDRWAASTDLNWASLEALPSDIEAAVCQLMTELSERAYYEGAVWSGWLPEVSYGYHELKLFLSTAIFDLARHTEAFRKRALSNGGGLGIQAPTDFNRVAQEARSFPELAAVLFVQDSMLLTLFQHGDEIAQNELERDLYRLVARDRDRLMQYQVERLKHYLFKHPDRREEQELYFYKAEHRLMRDWLDPAVSEPLAVLLGGGVEQLDTGMTKLQELRKAQVQDYLARLAEATYTRGNLNPRMAALIGE